MADQPPDRSAFAGGDQDYLRTEQYADGRNLDVRSRLHLEFGSATTTLAAFEAALVDWPAGSDVLECGCGTGRLWSDGGVPDHIRLTLTDLSTGMVDEASATARAHGYDVVGAQACDVQSLPFADSSFDIVVANHMLYHVPDPALAISEIARVLRPDGVLLAATNGYGHMDVVTELIAEVFEDHGDGLYEVFGIDTGERQLRDAFDSITWHAYVNDLLVDDADALVAYGLSFPPGEHADDAGRVAFADAVRRRMADGAVLIRTRAGVFVCRGQRPHRRT